MKNNYIVYMHTMPNNKVYIGITCQNPKKRWAYGYGYKKNKYFFSAIQKYGWNNIKHIIIAENLSKKYACEMEKELIKKYKSNNNKYGYNFSTGGEAPYGVVFSEERKKKISEAKKGHIVSEETRKKISQTKKGENNWNFGIKMSKETCEKISKSKKGKKLTDEHKSKLKLWEKGHEPWNKGKNLSQETIEKIRATRKSKHVICIETNKIYNSMREAYRLTKTNYNHIAEVCKGKRKTAGGYHWDFVGGVE